MMLDDDMFQFIVRWDYSKVSEYCSDATFNTVSKPKDGCLYKVILREDREYKKVKVLLEGFNMAGGDIFLKSDDRVFNYPNNNYIFLATDSRDLLSSGNLEQVSYEGDWKKVLDEMRLSIEEFILLIGKEKCED